MAFPQSSAVLAVLNGQEYWRLFTPLVSSGDIYESEQSGRAFVIGPQSDVAQVGVTYFDPQTQTNANCVSISVDKPLIGRLDALGTQQYQSGDQARLLISTNDLLPPPGFRPPSAAVTDTVQTVQPRIDLFQYLSVEPDHIPPRANRVNLFESLPGAATTGHWFLVPFYGRRFAEVTTKILAPVPDPVTVDIKGINFSNIITSGVVADPGGGHQEVSLATYVVPGPGLGGTGLGVSASIVDRAFDFLAIKLTFGGGFGLNSMTLHIVVSDNT